MICDSVLRMIGNTPMVRLSRLGCGINADVLAKLEYLNPSGSIKDRIALRMIEDAEREGKLRPGMRIIEASTGNTATALAFVGAVKGYGVTLYVPDTAASEERIRICKSYGAQVVTVNTEDQEDLRQRGIHGAVAEIIPRQVCLQVEQKDPDTWWARQFCNPSNATAHEETTAKEILEQTDGKVDAFVAAIGTGGTLVGVARALKAHNPSVRIVAVEPKNSRTIKNGRPSIPVIEGISGGLLLQVAELADEVVAVEDDEAIAMCHRLAEEEGLFCGISSGANTLVALRVARELGGGKTVATILVDSRDRYLFVERFTT